MAMTKHMQRHLLRQRLADMLAGADGSNFPEEFDGLITPGALSLWLMAIRDTFLTDKLHYLVGIHCLDHFETLDDAVEHLLPHIPLPILLGHITPARLKRDENRAKP